MDVKTSLTTAQKTEAALAVACPDHQVAAGVRCPSGWDGACMTRRGLALGEPC